MVEINASVFIQIINFIILIWALNKFLYTPIRNALSKRKQMISGIEDAIKQSEQSVVEKDQILKISLKEAREKGLKEKEAFENESRDKEKKLIEKINEKIRADLAEIHEKIAIEVETGRLALQKEIDFFADEISRKILGRAA